MKKLPVLSLFLFFLCSNLFAESSFEIFKHNGKTLFKFVSKETEVREYDLQGNLIAEVTPFKNTKYEYDSMGNQIYAFESDSLGDSNEIFREFSEDNNLIYEKGSASGEYIFNYDENKNADIQEDEGYCPWECYLLQGTDKNPKHCPLK